MNSLIALPLQIKSTPSVPTIAESVTPDKEITPMIGESVPNDSEIALRGRARNGNRYYITEIVTMISESIRTD